MKAHLAKTDGVQPNQTHCIASIDLNLMSLVTYDISSDEEDVVEPLPPPPPSGLKRGFHCLPR
jgi:hypothetical protein